MSFDWLISISAGLLTSVLGNSAEKVLAEKPVLTEQKVTPDATEADLVHILNGVKAEKFVPREKMTELENKKLTKKALVQELIKVVEKKLPANFKYLPRKNLIKFRDISARDEVFADAQKLKSLDILPENNGFFGKPNQKNPVLKINEVKKIVKRAFNKNGELNFLTDKDNDGVPNSLDACPDIPAKNGCPEPKNDDQQGSVLQVAPPIKAVEEKEIVVGDEISAIIFDPATGEIFSQSNIMKVDK